MSPGSTSGGRPPSEGGGSIDKGDERRAAEYAQALRSSVADSIRGLGPSLLGPDELDEIWSQTVIDFVAYVKRRDIQNVFATLRSIAKRRRADWIRRRVQERRMFEEHAPSIVRTYMVNAEGPRDSEFRELKQLIVSLLALLPNRQRIVTSIWLSGLPETNDMSVLRELVSEMTGEEETLSAVKRALEVGRQRIRAALLQNGVRSPGLLGGES